jgi:phytoene synthase
MGVRSAAALRHAAHLGMAMQLTNIARDVREDWSRGRLYLPEDSLTQFGLSTSLHAQLGQPLPPLAATAIARATEALLRQAEAYYCSGDAGVEYLSARCGLAIRAARLVYSEIGARLRAEACDPFAPRAVVSRARKWELVAQAVKLSAGDVRARLSQEALRRAAPRVPGECVQQPETLFMVS